MDVPKLGAKESCAQLSPVVVLGTLPLQAPKPGRKSEVILRLNVL